MIICEKCNIVYVSVSCPLCNLREHNNEVHNFIESKGQQLIDELVSYQNSRKTSNTKEDSQNVNQQLKGLIFSLYNRYVESLKITDPEFKGVRDFNKWVQKQESV